MICQNCRNAGALLQASETIPGLQKRYRQDAKELHAKCRGGTHCDCQHWTESSGIQPKYRGKNGNN